MIAGHRRAGDKITRLRHQAGRKGGHLDERLADADFAQDPCDDIAERVNSRAAELEHLTAETRRVVQCRNDRLRNVNDVNRLKACIPRDDGHHGQLLAKGCEAIDELVFGTKDDRRAKNCRLGQRRAHARLARRLGLGIPGTARCRCADRRNLHECRDAGRGSSPRDIGGTVGLNCRKCLPARLGEDADEIDACRRTVKGTHETGIVAHVAANDLHLTKAAQRLQERRSLGRAHDNADPHAGMRQFLHQISPEKSRSADDDNQPVHALIPISTAACLMAQRMPVDNRGPSPYPPPLATCPGGGIGRRASFRCWYW